MPMSYLALRDLARMDAVLKSNFDAIHAARAADLESAPPDETAAKPKKTKASKRPRSRVICAPEARPARRVARVQPKPTTELTEPAKPKPRKPYRAKSPKGFRVLEAFRPPLRLVP